jgi:hypothetical protein
MAVCMEHIICDTLIALLIFAFSFNRIYVISCRLVLLFGETGVLGEDHRPVAIH